MSPPPEPSSPPSSSALALAESEARLRLAAETAHFGVHDFDLTTGLIHWTSELYALTGIPIGTPITFELTQAIIEPEDRARIQRAMAAALDVHGSGEFSEEFRIRRPDTGEVRWVRNRCRTLFTDEGAARRAVRNTGVVWDITAEKETELALARALVAVREADRRKDEFLAMLAHELRNPLAPISNAVHVLRRTSPGDPRMATAQEIIDRQVRHLVRLVDDLLDVSRVSRGKITLRREVVDLALVVHQAVETTRPLLEAREHTLTVTLPDAPVCVNGDVTRLTQVVSNLLNNAAKYTEPRGHIEVRVERIGEGEASRAVLRVKDDGRGIDPSVLPAVFDLFFQVERNLDRVEGGLGIGLSLVKNLVELHGGHVEAHSEGRGRGSEVVVTFPALA